MTEKLKGLPTSPGDRLREAARLFGQLIKEARLMNGNCMLQRSRRRLIESYIGRSEAVLAFGRGLLILLGLAVVCPEVRASFEPLPVGARASGMGEAATAVADDVYSLYYNPAGLMQLTRPELGAYYSRLFVGLSDNSEIARSFVGYGQPLGKEGRWGSGGISYLSLTLSGLYKEETVGFGYACSLRERWNVGGSLKWLKKTIGTDEYTNNAINPVTGAATGQADPLFANGRSKSAAAFDVGTQYQMSSHYALGAVIRNLNAPNMALGAASDPAPRYYAVGVARRTRESAISVEAGEYKSTQGNYRISLGGERWFEAIGIRAGFAVGSRSYSVGSFGASYRLPGFQLDYAMNYPLQGVKGTLGNQQISLTMRFGKPPADPLQDELLRERQKRLEAEAEVMEARAERDRLKGEIEKLTQLPPPAPPAAEPAASPAEPAAVAAQVLDLERSLKVAQEKIEKGEEVQVRKVLLGEYAAGVEEYLKLRRTGATAVARLEAIRKLARRFEGSELDLTAVRQERNSLEDEVAKAERDYKLSLGFYETLVKRGASAEERRRMLERILARYKPVGLDVGSVERELELLRGEE